MDIMQTSFVAMNLAMQSNAVNAEVSPVSLMGLTPREMCVGLQPKAKKADPKVLLINMEHIFFCAGYYLAPLLLHDYSIFL